MVARRPGHRTKEPRASSASPPPTRKRRSPEEAREAILEAAAPLLVAHGPDKVGLQAVARAAGVSHALVTHYFGTYEALVREVLLRRNQTLAEEFQRELLESTEPPGARLLLERFASVLQHGGQGRLLAWALLTGRTEHLPLARTQGLRLVMEALEFQVGRMASDQGHPPPSHEDLEMALVVGLCASQWYALAREMLLPSLGLPVDAGTDARFRAALATMLHTFVGLAPPPQR